MTMIDNGMPCVLIAADDLGISGYETPTELEGNTTLSARLKQLRLRAGPLMNLGDVREKSVPKITLIAPPKSGGAISTRTFIPIAVTKPLVFWAQSALQPPSLRVDALATISRMLQLGM